MKKQKPLSPTIETVPGKELLFAIAVGKNPLDQINQWVANPILKGRGEAKLLLLSEGDVNIDGHKELTELRTANRLFIFAMQANGLEKDNLPDGLFYLIDSAKTFQFSLVQSLYQQNKKALATAEIGIGKWNELSGKITLPFLTKVKKWGYNFLAQLFLPTALTDYTHTYYFFSKSFLETYYTQLQYSSLQLVCKATYHDIPVTDFPLTQKESAPQLNQLGSILKTAFVSRWDYFIADLFKSKPVFSLGSNAPLFRTSFVLLFFVALFLLPYFSFDYGITWDARRHNSYGYEMLKYFDTDGEDKTALSETSPTQEFRYYGEHFNVIAAWLNTYVKAWGEFETRHLLNALYGFLAMLFAAFAAKEIAGWRAAVVAFVFILLSPVFFGHSMNNPTDIPFAAGSMMAIYYLIKVLRNLPQPKFTYILWCGAGIGMAIGARIGGVVLYAYTGLFMGLSWLAYARAHSLAAAIKLLRPYFITGLLIFIIGHLVAISLWPFGQEEPWTNWLVALEKSTSKDPSSSFFTYNHELFEGVRMYMANVPLYYLPKFIFINSPLFVLVGILLLLVSSFAWKKLFQARWIYIGLIAFTFVFPIVYAEYQGMYYYNGWRHYLFTYPPLIVLTAIGWESILRWVQLKPIQYGIGIVIIGLLSLPFMWMVKNHPNEVVYYNELVGGTKGAYGNYEMDYYSNSCREAAEWIAKQEPSRNITVAINNEPLTGAYWAQKTNPNIQFQWVREYEEGKPFWDYAIFTSRTYSKNELLNGAFPPKGSVYTVMADGAPLAAVVKRDVYYMPLGYKAFEANQNDSAIYYFKEAAKWNPMDEEAFRMCGIAYASKQQWDSGIVETEKAIALFTENYMAYSNLGLMYFNGKKDLPKALEYFKKANSFKFNYTDAYYYSSMVEYQRGDYRAGIKYLENATKRGGSGVPEIYYNLGLGYYNVQSYAKAEENLKLCLTINPKMAMGYRLLAEVFTKENKPQEAQFCMQKYQELGGR